jgi:hypothetical protein
MHRLPLKEGS